MTRREKGEIMRHCIAGIEAQESATTEIDDIIGDIHDIREAVICLQYCENIEQQLKDSDILGLISKTQGKVVHVGANLMIVDDAIDAISQVAGIDLLNLEQEEN